MSVSGESGYSRRLGAVGQAGQGNFDGVRGLAFVERLANNGADPDRQLNGMGLRMDTDLKLRVADVLGRAAGADEQRHRCESFLGYWGSAEGSFRFNEYYERLMAL